MTMPYQPKNCCQNTALTAITREVFRPFQWAWLLAILVSLFGLSPAYAVTPISHYSFDDIDWVANGIINDHINGHDATVNGAMTRLNSDNAASHQGTCAAARFAGGSLDIFGLPVSTTQNDTSSVSFWMYWDGTNSVMPMGWIYHDLWLVGGSFGFNTANSDIYGISSAGLANGWHHIAAVFTNGDVTQNVLFIDGVKQSLSQRRSSPTQSRAYVNSRLRLGGWHANTGYRFSGAIDEFKLYHGTLTQAEVTTDMQATSQAACVDPIPQAEQLIASYNFNDDWSSSEPLIDNTGTANGIINGAVTRVLSPANGNKPDTCSAAEFNGGVINIENLPVSTTTGDKTSISFWMNWNGTNSVMPLGWYSHDLWFYGGNFGFNTASGDIYGISSTGLADSWQHIAVVFTNNNVTDNKIYINGVEQTLSLKRNTINHARALVDPHLRLGGWGRDRNYRFKGQLDDIHIYNGEITLTTLQQDLASLTSCKPPIEYHFDAMSWSGKAQEVIDSSPYAYHGTAFNGVNTRSVDPVVDNTPGTCRYARFNGDDDYIAVPDIDNLTEDFTITAWIRSDKARPGRIFADDDNNSGGFALSLNDPGSGKLRFFSRRVRPVSLDTPEAVVPQDGNWYFVSAVHDISNQYRAIYVNGKLAASGTYTGTWGTDNGITTIGSESDDSREGVSFAAFKGDIDELKVYRHVLSQSQIQQVMTEVHACSNTPSLDHIELHYPKTGLTCQTSAITIKACANADCSTLLSDDVTLTMSPATGWPNNPLTLIDGSATLDLTTPSAGNVTLSITDSSPLTSSDTLCFADKQTDATCSMTIADAGFIFDVPNLTACKPSADITIRAVKQGENTNQCVSALSGNQTLSFSSNYVLPTTGKTAVNLNGKDIANTSKGTDIELVFDSNGEATFITQYDDAGEIDLTASYDNGSGSIMTGSDTFVSKPVALVAYSEDNNADCHSEDAQCSVFKKAGETFNLALKAACWTDDADTDFSDNPSTPNFALDSIGIQPQVIAPINGINGQVEQASITITTADKGIHIVKQAISEVGVFRFNVTAPPYLGESINTISSPAIGRFIPDHFATTTRTDGTFSANLCGYRYSGEHFSYLTPPQLTITAYNAAQKPTVTYNYRDDFAKLVEADISLTPPSTDANQLGADNVTLVPLNWVADTPSLTNNNDGTLTVTFGQDNYVYLKQTNSQIAPFNNAVNLTMTRITDSDDVSTSTLPHTLQPNGLPIRFGRIAIDSLHGSELTPLSLTVRTEYHDGHQWATHTADSCTTLDLNADLRLSSPTTANGSLQTGTTTMTVHNGSSSATITLLNAGTAQLTFSAPGEENQGYIDVVSHLVNNQPWLLRDHDNDGVYSEEATARASFGLFRGSRHILFRREQY